jgi:hypothetical protein
MQFGVVIDNEYTYELCMKYCLLSQKLQADSLRLGMSDRFNKMGAL